MATKRSIPNDFDESDFIESFRYPPKPTVTNETEVQTTEIQPTEEREPPPKRPPRESRSRKSHKEEYLATFFESKSDVSPRQCKSMMLRPEYHRKLQLIVHVIAGDEITLFNYIDNIIANHLKHYESDISEIYDERSSLLLKH